MPMTSQLKDQWRRELRDKFDEHFIVIERSILDALFCENAWLRENQAITSIDFAKRDDIIPVRLLRSCAILFLNFTGI